MACLPYSSLLLCPLVAGVRAFGLVLSSGGVFSTFCPLSCFMLVVLLANMALFAILRGFLEGFWGFVWVCSFWVLCVACGAFVCVRCLAVLWPVACLPLFLFFCPFVFLSCPASPALLLGFLPCLLSCSLSCLLGFVACSGFLLGLLFLFPFRTICKRQGAIPCVLSSWVVGCLIWSLLCIPRTRLGLIRQYRNEVLEKGNLNGCSKLSCVLQCSYLCSSRFVFLLFSYLFLLVGS